MRSSVKVHVRKEEQRQETVLWHDATVMQFYQSAICQHEIFQHPPFSPVAPMQDLSTLKEQHREQKLLPQLLQFLCNRKRHCVETCANGSKTKLNVMMTWCLNISPNSSSFQSHPFLQHWEDCIAARTVACVDRQRSNALWDSCSKASVHKMSFFNHWGII